METPVPVDVNRLKSILGNAKKVMAKVENNDFTTGHVDARALNEDGIAQLQSEGVTRTTSQNSSTAVSDYTEEQVRNSNLPPAVKKAMLENKIPKVSMANTSFSLNDVSDLVEKPMGLPKTPQTRINESVVGKNSDMITISKSELNNIINERLLEFFTKMYTKTITEDTVKSTITTLIKEGKIAVKKKTA